MRTKRFNYKENIVSTKKKIKKNFKQSRQLPEGFNKPEFDLNNETDYNLYDNKFFIKECYFLIEKAEDRIKDIFGIKATTSHGQRLNGPFGSNEYIVGAYLSKLFFISLIFFIISRKNYLYLFLYLIFILFITLITKERMASLMLIFTS